MKSAFFFDRTTAPSWSSRCSRKTSTSSPSLSECASLNSSIGTAPSDLNPTSRMTAASVTRSTFDLTISPSSMFERVPSYISVIFAISSGEYSSCRSERTRRWECGVGAEGASGCASWVYTSMPYTGSVVSLGFRGRRNLAEEALARQRHDPCHLLVHGEPGSVEQDRVGRGAQRGGPTGRIGAVPRPQRVALALELGRVDAV